MNKLHLLHEAEKLYSIENLTPEMIAEKLNISRRTIFNWKKKYKWDNHAIYLRATNLMTGRWLLEEIAKEMDEIPRYLTSDNFNLIAQKLKQKPQLIIVDEIDYLMNNLKTIEILRDIHDETDCPIIFVGMGLAHKKLERYKHLFDRFSEIVKFETFGVNDIAQIINQLAEIKFTADSIEYIHKKYNRFRQIVQLINQLEMIAKDNNLQEINLDVIKEIL